MQNSDKNSEKKFKKPFSGKMSPGGKSKKPAGHKYPVKEKTAKVAPRGQANLFGYHAVEAAWRNDNRRIEEVFATQAAWDSFSERIADYKGPRDPSLPGGQSFRPAPKIITRAEMDKILPNQVHQGIAINAHPLAEVFLSDVIIASQQAKQEIILMLDQVTDPHNVGAIVRSACAFGVSTIIQQRRHAPLPEGVLAKTASGAAEYVDFIYETNLSDAIIELQQAGFTAIALDEQGEDLHHAITIPPQKCVFVLGAEGKGLRPKIKETCNLLVSIPTAGPISSLNVSNAAAIGLFALSSTQNKG